MKKLLFAVMLPLLLLGFESWADPRIGKECHYTHDADNADNEFKEPNCIDGVIRPFTENGVEKAHGRATLKIRLSVNDFTAKGLTRAKLRGDGNLLPRFQNYVVLADSDCVMVTRNWNNATQSYDTTEYRTRDWNTTVDWSDYEFEDRSFEYEFTVACRDGLKI